MSEPKMLKFPTFPGSSTNHGTSVGGSKSKSNSAGGMKFPVTAGEKGVGNKK